MTPLIRFDNFDRQFQTVGEACLEAVRRVMERGWFVLGEEGRALEQSLEAFLDGSGEVVGVASGTDALTLALWALGVGEGDEVITSSMSAFPTITAIIRAGARPVLADISPEDGLLDPQDLPRCLSERTRAVIPVHLYGQSCDLEPILAFARTHGLKVIEDCAQAIGATYRGRRVGTWGDCGAFSFYPTKNLGACGDGGAVRTGDPGVAERLRRLRNYGQRVRYHHDSFGMNSRLDEMQAAILSAKLPHLEAWNLRRRHLAGLYREGLRAVSPLRERAYGVPVYHLMAVLSEQRESLMAHLEARGIQTLIHYPLPLQEQAAFRPFQAGPVPPGVGRFASRVLSLPLYPELGEEEVARVVEEVNAHG